MRRRNLRDALDSTTRKNVLAFVSAEVHLTDPLGTVATIRSSDTTQTPPRRRRRRAGAKILSTPTPSNSRPQIPAKKIARDRSNLTDSTIAFTPRENSR
jgi:hypothetical protein